MKARRITFLATAFVLGFASFGCSDDDGPTDPNGGGNPGGTAFNSGSMTAPATYVRSFPTAGTVGYHCTFHRNMGMTGTVTVAAGAADSIVVAANALTFAPATVTIRPGGYVRWNVTVGTHTVTSD